MNIAEILEEKRKELFHTGNPLQVQFTLDEINVLADVDELRRLKLAMSFPEDFEKSSDLFDCAKRIIGGERDYRILEFCILKNKVLRAPVSQVFRKILN